MASDHFADLANMTKDQLRDMHQGPMGTEPRSGQEEAALWRKLRRLPPEQFNGVLNFAAADVGHQHDEKQPCDVCKFVMRGAEREGKRQSG